MILDGEVVDDDQDDDDTAEQSAAHRHRALLDWAVVIVVALLVAFLVRTFVLAHFVVDGTSMFSTLHDDDRVFVNKLSYRLHDPNRGDVVVLHQSAGASERDLIKRVVALPGETIEVRSCQVVIDGQTLEEPYLDPEVVTPGNCGGDLAPLTIPEDHVFVMGDNRGGSQDSRRPRADRRGRPRRPGLHRLLAPEPLAVALTPACSRRPLGRRLQNVGQGGPPSSAMKASTITSTWSL